MNLAASEETRLSDNGIWPLRFGLERNVPL
jgi:hypothetical protein